MDKYERNKIINAILFPALFVAVIGIVHLITYAFNFSLTIYGVFPRKLSGLIGIFSGPLIHGDFAHLFNNSIPILILGSALFYFYKEVAFKVSIWIYIMVGVWTWVSAREAYHIGASGLLYGLFSFLMVSGFIRKNKHLISLSFAMIFLYGSLVWGIFPIDIKISFEGHMWGFISGIILAFYFKKQGPQKVEHVWDDDEDDDEGTDAYWKEKPKGSVSQQYTYIYKPKSDE